MTMSASATGEPQDIVAASKCDRIVPNMPRLGYILRV